MMRNKISLLAIIFFVSVKISSQTNLNDYKYIIVPEQYSFFKTPNQYRLNELGKFLFNKYGFTAFLTNEEFPDDLRHNGCLALRTEVNKEPGLFVTKLKLILKDCKGNTVFVSRIGSTREKDLTKAYNLALRNAFKTFENVNYKYVPKEKEVIATTTNEPTNTSEEVKRLQDKVKALQVEKEKQLRALEEAKVTAEKQKLNKENPEDNLPTLIEDYKEFIQGTTLYAQSIDNGYQLVDSTPKVIMLLLETGKKDTFIVKDQNATVYKEDGLWLISRIENNKPVIEKINIKF